MVSHLATNSEADGNGSSDDVSPDAFSLSSNQRQIAVNAECTMAMKTADFPSTGGDINIFERDCFHGGPVTAAYVRFPPHQYINTATFDTKLNHEHMRSQGRVVFARGPWIESHSMFPYRGQDGGDSKQSYKVMAFGGDCEGGSTFESIQGMLFPTSSSSLSYLDTASEIYQDASRWGHTARVWEVSFAHYPSHHQPNNSVTLVSAGEDSTARIWSPLDYEKEIVHPLRGHRCESLWTVDVCEGVIITGGNDGCVKMWDLESRVSQSQLSGGGVQTFVAPKDPVQLTPTSEQPSLMPSAIENDTSSSSQKKKRKKSKPKGQVIFGMEFFSSNELMVATRAGGLFSLDIAHYTWTTHKDWSQNVVTASCGIDAEIDPSTGNCIGIYSNDNRLAIGTTDGWLILSHISAIPSTNVAFRAESYRSVQSLSWIDGGNLLVFFARGTIIWWRIESNNLPVILHIMALGTDGVPVSFAYDAQDCSLTLTKATIDHRMNSVRAIPVQPYDQICHLVCSGDSDGNLHLIAVSEQVLPRRTAIGNIITGSGRPVLCIELLRCSDHILSFVGNTAGEVCVWKLPGNFKGSETQGLHSIGELPTSPIFVFKAHQTGVNDLSVAIIPNGDKYNSFDVVCCSVGDDQTLTTCLLTFDEQFCLRKSDFVAKQCASASPLKSVKLVTDVSTFHRVYASGQDECTTLWRLNTNPLSIEVISSTPLGTEGSCIDCVHIAGLNGGIKEVIAIGGEGVELQSVDLSILSAATKLLEANYLLITAGAGFSADSGLSTYECAPSAYKELCNASKLIDETHRFQRFWMNFTKSYLATSPHSGYSLLDQWCGGGRLPYLKREDTYCKAWWVYSSNVDGHFRRFSSFGESVCEIHGVADEFRCACSIGYAEGHPRLGKEWETWNAASSSLDECKHTVLKMNNDYLVNSEELFLCRHCNRPMRPNVLMFHDTDDNVLRDIAIQRERYQAWESRVEEAVFGANRSLVILELGCGVNVPAVRHESEEVLMDCAKVLYSQETDAKGFNLHDQNQPQERRDRGQRRSGFRPDNLHTTES
eukprot:g4287.t1 g4287   contig15:720441-725473(+)